MTKKTLTYGDEYGRTWVLEVGDGPDVNVRCSCRGMTAGVAFVITTSDLLHLANLAEGCHE